MSSLIQDKKISRPLVGVVLGPTSTGKSDFAVRLAQELDGEIISADSRQVFRDMNLGTGKVEGAWKKLGSKKVFIYQDIPHYAIDFVSPRRQYNVSHFKKDCQILIKDILQRKKLPILCGGTGFWISAVVYNLNLPTVKPNQKLRKSLAKKTPQELFALLKTLDSHRAQTIDKNNPIRLIRAIEVAQALGKVPPLATTDCQDYRFLQIGLDFPIEQLAERIKFRLKKRFSAGMIEEVRQLKEKYRLSWKKIQSFGLAYYWIPLFLQNQLNRKELEEKVFLAERQYAKRQKTWFKRDTDIIWENNFPKALKIFKKRKRR